MNHAQPQTNGLAIAALTCGLVGVVLGSIPILFAAAWALGITAIVLGLIGRGRQHGAGMATWGALLGVAAFALGCYGLTVVQDTFSPSAEEEVIQELEGINPTPPPTPDPTLDDDSIWADPDYAP